ncbi:MAG: DNA gyrase subunit A [Gammaproteobacteria bacterium]|nr:MAG: DNA gyrase subunit A [Gammaproteobacteria bacterium]
MGEIAAKEIVPINLEDELKQSYLNYAMHVIVGRALPDARDGLKPVHRRILYAMHVLNNDWNKPPKKSMRIVGDVTGKYHPHGDTAAYETIVRMAQWWSLRYTLVEGQGNFGSMDGDPPAAARYTEVRMERIAHELLEDLDKETVKFIENYDGQETMPDVLPARIPNLLVNGSSGIAVGMATNMAPHNLDESISACLAYIENPEISIDELIKLIPGPDFPTGGIINGRSGIRSAYETGKGKVQIRAKTNIQGEDEGKPRIIVTEIPYMVNKAKLVESIAYLMRDKKIEGIREVRDESDKDNPVRIVIELRTSAVADVVLNNLYKQTQMQSVFGINNVALVGTEPKLLSLKEILGIFFSFRKEVVSKRTFFELRKARERGHILEGLTIALSNIDSMIELIKKSKDGNEARSKLLSKKWKAGNISKMLKKAGAEACRPEDLDKNIGLKGSTYQLSDIQAQAILDMRLQRLTGLEQDRLIKEYEEIIDLIGSLMEILSDNSRLVQVVSDELKEIQEKYKDERKTLIQDSVGDLSAEDLITPEDRVVTISHEGYAKTQPLDEYRSQRRGGTGKTAASVKEEDFVEQLLVANTHTTLLCFSNLGQVYWLKVYDIPAAGRAAKGRPLVNLIRLNEDERITSMVPVEDYKEGHFILMATKTGTVKKTPLSEFSNQRKGGKRAITLVGDDELVGTRVTDGKKFVMLVSNAGKAAHFSESEVRSMGRNAQGVRGIKLDKSHQVISLIIPEEDATILTVSENGYGKRSVSSDFRKTRRGAKGVIAMQTSDRNGQLIGAAQVSNEDQVMLITNKGMLVRTKVSEINVIGRNTQGVTVIKLKDSESLISLARISEEFIDQE